MSYFRPRASVQYKSAQFDSATVGNFRVTGNFFSGPAATSVASTWTPASIPDGWWLDSRYNVAANVSTWGNRGTLLPEFQLRANANVTVSQHGMQFPGGNADFFYESSPVAHSDDMTMFCVYRAGVSPGHEGALMGKYKTSTNERAWQLNHTDATGHTVLFATSPNGTTVTTTSVSPAGAPRYRYHTIIVRKNGTALDSWFDGNKVAINAAVSTSVLSSVLPVTIGGRGGTASTDGSPVGFVGFIRHIGFYRTALSDTSIDLLSRWLLKESQWFVRGSAFDATAAGYRSLPGTSAVVVAPNGQPPSRTEPITHRYRHHVAVGKLSTSHRIWISHSSGAANEDASGQQVHCEYSDDGGVTWSAPLVAVGSIPGGALLFGGNAYESNIHICFSRGFYQYKGKLYVTVSVLKKQSGPPYDASTLAGAALLARECMSDGTLGTLFRIDAVANGYTDIASYDAVLSPPLFALANQFGIWGGDGPAVVSPAAAWTGWVVLDGEPSTTLVAPTTCSLDGSDENLVRLWRCSTGPETGVFWSSRSWNGGSTWTHPTPTDVPNSPSTGCLIRLSDGRFAFVCNAKNISGGTDRAKMSLMLFDADGKGLAAYVVYDAEGTAVEYSGTFKTGALAYPGMVQDSDVLHIAFSLWKESMLYTKVKIPVK